jgi:hypothetical protein
MLTESREAMSFRKTSQILAIASLSSPQFNANRFLPTSAPFPKFVNPCGTLSHELRKHNGALALMFSSAARRFEVPGWTRGILWRNFKSAALAAICPFYRL